jgi:GNAT superfamily N-acetyltransferase
MLLDQASSEELEEAVAENHAEWMKRKALAAGGEVHNCNGVQWTYAGAEREGNVLFPRLTEANVEETLETIVRFYRKRRPEPLIGCWSLVPTRPINLGERLLAHGFQPGWQPRWMSLDLRNVKTEYSTPPELRIERLSDPADWEICDLPYYERSAPHFRDAAAADGTRNIWHFAAFLNGVPVGHTTLHINDGPRGVAGIYDVGVVASARNQGIGKAVTGAACLYARSQGCLYALLNATGRRMYEQIGFELLGFGDTWWLNARK